MWPRAEIGLWAASSPPAPIAFSAGGAQKITRFHHRHCHPHLHPVAIIVITTNTSFSAWVWQIKMYHHLNHHHRYHHFRHNHQHHKHQNHHHRHHHNDHLRTDDHSALSFRAKTVYKVVTVVQPPFMMWNATTGDHCDTF